VRENLLHAIVCDLQVDLGTLIENLNECRTNSEDDNGDCDRLMPMTKVFPCNDDAKNRITSGKRIGETVSMKRAMALL